MKKAICFLCALVALQVYAQQTLYVSATGNDKNKGTLASPFKTIQAALQKTATQPGKTVTVLLRKGKYVIDKTIIISPAILNGHTVSVAPYQQEEVTISSAKKIKPQWKTWKGKILQAFIGKALSIDQLYANGRVLPMARYPNYDSTQRVFNGTAADVLNKERTKKWANPVGGYIHALHQGEWGGFHYKITGKSADGSLQLEGGWQNNRPSQMNAQHKFAENIFEELDAPGEWFYNAATGIVYFYPSMQFPASTSVFEYATLTELIKISGNETNPVKNFSISGIHFTQTSRSFMQTKEPLLRSDWTIYRGGAILIEGAEDVQVKDCSFDQLGGNAVFVSNYNRRVVIEGNSIEQIGGSAISFVGNAGAVRSPSFQYSEFVALDKMDKTPGPKTNNYPAQCTAYNNLIHDIGRIEKQVAGVEISMAKDITISHNTIYNTPRSGINIGDGCWGGHILEYNDVFNTVLETGDHGAFNSWGRDRFWLPDIKTVDTIVANDTSMPYWDAISTTIMRNNRFHCAHGWDIDLDDGSTNYHIYNNVCLNGGLKLREGYGRIVENNILINNSFHPHVWFAKSEDVFRHNIVSTDYAPIGINNWGKQVDSNFFLFNRSLLAAQQNKTDQHSLSGDALFADPVKGDYTIAENSMAHKIGFVNFSMNEFGVVSPALKAQSAKAPVPDSKMLQPAQKGETYEWLGATVKNIESLGERSAAGLFDENGVLVLKVPANSLADKSGLKEKDVLRSIDGKPIKNMNELTAAIQLVQWQGNIKATIVRNQQEQAISLQLK